MENDKPCFQVHIKIKDDEEYVAKNIDGLQHLMSNDKEVQSVFEPNPFNIIDKEYIESMTEAVKEYDKEHPKTPEVKINESMHGVLSQENIKMLNSTSYICTKNSTILDVLDTPPEHNFLAISPLSPVSIKSNSSSSYKKSN